MTRELILYTHPQSRGAIVQWMLEEIGQPYSVRVLEYGTTMKAPEYLAINPMGKVPVIQHGDVVVTETAAICAYLADAFPQAGLAPALADRGEYYRWLFFAAGCGEPAMFDHAAGWIPDTPEQQGSLGYGTFEMTFDTLAGWLAGRTYVAGNRFSAADVYVASLLHFGMEFNLIPRTPEFEAYVTPLQERAARQRAEASIQALMAKADSATA